VASAEDNLFMVNNEKLVLPEVPSKLNFEVMPDFASDNDTSGQVWSSQVRPRHMVQF
jgi:hypothetical protein